MPVYEGPTIDEAIAQGLHALGLKKRSSHDRNFNGCQKRFPRDGKKTLLVFLSNPSR